MVVEAIIRNNKDNLLKRFISEYDYVKIVNGALVTEVRIRLSNNNYEKEYCFILIYLASTCSCDDFLHQEARSEMRLHSPGFRSQG